MPPQLEGGSHDWSSPDLPSFTSVVTYSCGTARKLEETHLDGSTEYHTTQTLTCLWNQTWQPVAVIESNILCCHDNIYECYLTQPFPCKWTKCLEPEDPATFLGLRREWNGMPVPFWENVTYMCQQGLYFVEDRDKAGFSVTCQDNGQFDYPLNWPPCTRGEHRTNF